MRVALVYDRVNKWGGAERVLLALHQIFPEAPLYTSVFHQKKAAWAKVFPEVISSVINNFKFFRDKHEYLGLVTPILFESFDFKNFDLVISVSSEAAKGIITGPSTFHLNYCLTPTRYLWSGYDTYFANPLLKLVSQPVVSYLRNWDKIAAYRADKTIAISQTVRKRISKYYSIDSQVVYPPVNLNKFVFSDEIKKENYFLVVSRLVKYKRVDLVIEAFNKLGWPLMVIGEGEEEHNLKRRARKNIIFAKKLTDVKLASYYQKAQALICPQIEDFGLVSLEAQASGTPVIAYVKGGLKETIINGKTGLLFYNQNSNSLIHALKDFSNKKFDRKLCLLNAKKYSQESFKTKFLSIIRNI